MSPRSRAASVSKLALLAFVPVLALPSSSPAATIGDAQWSPLGGVPGTDGTIAAIAVGSGGQLYVGGTFSVAGETRSSNVAMWNGTAWVALGDGIDGNVYALALDGAGTLYAGGYFTSAGGVAASSIAKWDGSSWSALGDGVDGAVYAFAYDDLTGNLYVGGNFVAAGGSLVGRIAQWDGSGWSTLGAGMDDAVYALALDGSGILHAGGAFMHADAASAPHIAKWEGGTWTTLGTGVDSYVHALVWDGSGNLYAGGFFDYASGVPASGVAKWDGSVWSALGSGANNTVRALALDAAGNLWAGGSLTTAGGVAASHVARWNGSTWSAAGPGTSADVLALASDTTNVYAAGDFTTAGYAGASHLAFWNGTRWRELGDGMNGQVSTFALDGAGTLYAGGLFTSAGPVPTVNRIARWSSGTGWLDLGTGMNAEVRAVALDGAGTLYAGGSFTTAGSTTALRVARWSGTSWSALGPGVDGSVYAVTVDGAGALYAGGGFILSGATSMRRVAKAASGTWSALGTGANDTVQAVVLDGAGNLYAGGAFWIAGDVNVYRVAKWDGGTWSALGGGLDSTVYALALGSAGELYAAGGFTTALGGVPVNRIAVWNGSAWAPLGSGLEGGAVYALAADGVGNLYAGGAFTMAGGQPANHLARWDGSSWSALGSGTNQPVHALVLDDAGTLYVGGEFTIAGYGVAGYAARVDLPPGVSLTTGAPEPTSSSPLVVTVTFSEPVSGLDAGDFVVTNAAVSSLDVVTADRVWTIGITPATMGEVTVSLPADAVLALSDGSGNYASNTLSRTFTAADVQAPQVSSVTRLGATPTNADAVAFAVTFDESVTGVGPEDFALLTTGGVTASVLSVSGSGASYTVDVTSVAGDGTLRLDLVDTPTIADPAANPLSGPYTAGEVYAIDNTPPSPPEILAVADDTGASGDGVTYDTTLVVSGTSDPDVNVEVFRTGAVSLGVAAADGAGLWSLDCTSTPLSGGSDSLVATATDDAGNVSADSAPFVLVIDVTAPVVTAITRASASPTNATSLAFHVTSSEPTTGFDAGDLAMTATGTASGVVTGISGGGTSYTVTVGSVTGDGSLRLDVVSAPTVTDGAGVALVGPYEAGETFVVDNTPPDAPVVSSVEASTDDTTPTWTWTSGASAGSGDYRHQLDGQEAGGWVETRDGDFTPAAALSTGPHTLYVAERDAAGNWSAAGSFVVTVTDAASPEPPQVSAAGCGCDAAGSGRPSLGLLSMVLALGALFTLRRWVRTEP